MVYRKIVKVSKLVIGQDSEHTSASGAARVSVHRPRPAVEHLPFLGLYSLPAGHVTVRTVFLVEHL